MSLGLVTLRQWMLWWTGKSDAVDFQVVLVVLIVGCLGSWWFYSMRRFNWLGERATLSFEIVNALNADGFRNTRSDKYYKASEWEELQPLVKETSIRIIDRSARKKLQTDIDIYLRPKLFLGHGKFGTVYMSVDASTGKHFAVKEIKRGGGTVEQDLEHEIAMLQLADHPHVVNLEHVIHREDRTLLLLEYCAGGTLLDLLKCGRASHAQSETCAAHLLAGANHLHMQNIVHGDIKPSNILISRGNAKISDLGGAFQLKIDEPATKFVGTPCYAAPEVVCLNIVGRQVDIWSIGATIYHMLTLSFVFEDIRSWEDLRKAAEGMPLPPECSDLPPDAQKFLVVCLARDPQDRPSAYALQKYAFPKAGESRLLITQSEDNRSYLEKQEVDERISRYRWVRTLVSLLMTNIVWVVDRVDGRFTNSKTLEEMFTQKRRDGAAVWMFTCWKCIWFAIVPAKVWGFINNPETQVIPAVGETMVDLFFLWLFFNKWSYHIKNEVFCWAFRFLFITIRVMTQTFDETFYERMVTMVWAVAAAPAFPTITEIAVLFLLYLARRLYSLVVGAYESGLNDSNVIERNFKAGLVLVIMYLIMQYINWMSLRSQRQRFLREVGKKYHRSSISADFHSK